MRIYIPNYKRNDTGGGSAFCRNFAKIIPNFGHQIVDSLSDADCLFIPGATLCDRDVFSQAKKEGKHIILRVDNILEDSKNRSTGMSRMREFSERCDVVIYQSQWAKRLLSPICGDGPVIYNGVDTDIFYPRKEKKYWDNIRVFYSRWGRGEGKNFNVVQYFWREYCLENKDDTLVIVGKFGDETLNIANPFEFHNNENYEYKGIIQDPHQLADILRNCDVALLPYAFDCCSNSILEAQACGLPVIYHHSGGTPEIIEMGHELIDDISLRENIELALSRKYPDYFEEFKGKWGLYEMGRQYHGILTLLEQGQNDV